MRNLRCRRGKVRWLGLLGLALWLSSVPLAAAATPQLVVVVVIDQMRTDYLTRFADHFLPARDQDRVGGFNYLLRNGAVYWNAQYTHLATFTCAGHATILSGAALAESGIISNGWFDAARRQAVSCVDDLEPGAPARRTPRSMRVSTVGDELRLANQGKSKVIGIGYKDYAIMTLGGRDASLAVWFDRRTGHWVSNEYYLQGNALPAWVEQVNGSGLADRYRARVWDLLLPDEAYSDTTAEPVLAGDHEAGYGHSWTFPHTPPEGGFSYATLAATPFANELLVDTALAAIEEEGLGQDAYPDVLALAFSANDHVGHTFGPSSPEVMDITLRTDRSLARFFAALDEKLGLDRITLILTSDHGIQYIPREVVQARGNAGRLTTEALRDPVERALDRKFGAADWILHIDDLDLYLDHQLIDSRNLDSSQVQQAAAEALVGTPGVLTAFPAHRIQFGPLPPGDLSERIVRSFYPARSGDVIFVPEPNWFRDVNLATTHGPPHAYNARVPLILSGKGIRNGQHLRPVDIRDIAPTLSWLLGIGPPSGSSGTLLEEALQTP